MEFRHADGVLAASLAEVHKVVELIFSVSAESRSFDPKLLIKNVFLYCAWFASNQEILASPEASRERTMPYVAGRGDNVLRIGCGCSAYYFMYESDDRFQLRIVAHTWKFEESCFNLADEGSAFCDDVDRCL